MLIAATRRPDGFVGLIRPSSVTFGSVEPGDTGLWNVRASRHSSSRSAYLGDDFRSIATTKRSLRRTGWTGRQLTGRQGVSTPVHGSVPCVDDRSSCSGIVFAVRDDVSTVP